jgi:hypothetical protein
MDAVAFMNELQGLPGQDRAHHVSIMDVMGPVVTESDLCFTDNITAWVAEPNDVQVAHPLTEQDLERMRERRRLMRVVARFLRTNRIFDAAKVDAAMRELRYFGEVDDETRQRIMRVKGEKKLIAAYWEFLGTCVDRSTLPVETAWVTTSG